MLETTVLKRPIQRTSQRVKRTDLWFDLVAPSIDRSVDRALGYELIRWFEFRIVDMLGT